MSSSHTMGLLRTRTGATVVAACERSCHAPPKRFITNGSLPATARLRLAPSSQPHRFHIPSCTTLRNLSTNSSSNSSTGGATASPQLRKLSLPLALLLLGGLAWLSPTLHNEAGQKAEPPKNVTPVASGDPEGKLISMQEVEKHNNIDNGLWVVIQGEVYDLTDFVDSHPGGSNILLKNAGKDVTDIYMPIHPSNAIEDNLESEQHLGMVDPKTVTITQKEESEADKKRRIALENLPPVGAMLNLDDFERCSKQILTDQAWAYYSSAGDDEITANENRNAYGRVWFKPRILRKIGVVDPSSKLVGGTVDSALPIYISPAAMAKLGHPDGELNLTRAAGAHKIIQGVSANASVSLDEILAAREEGQPIVYQLYVNKDRAASERILQKIQEKGCSAVMLTVDAPVMGKRERDMRAKGEVVSTGGGSGGDTHGGGVAQAISGYIDPNLEWADIKWFKEHCKLPLYLKGIQTVDDVALAAQHGVQGVILSNHGGRSLDYSRPPLDVLIDLRQQRPDLFEHLEVWVDGGVRRGTDVVKALALGASAVGLGRPFLYAQSGFGQPGAERAIEIMRDEVERCMRLLGVTSLKELTPEMVEVLPRVFASTLPPLNARDSVPDVR